MPNAIEIAGLQKTYAAQGNAPAKQALKAAGFKTTTTTQDTTDPAQDGTVISQDPTGKGRKGDTVTLTVGKLTEQPTDPGTATETTPTTPGLIAPLLALMGG